MATIEFKDYIIEKSLYNVNPNFLSPTDDGNLILDDQFSAQVGISDGNGYVIIEVSLGDFSDDEKIKHVPFSLQVSIRGIFDYTLDKGESKSQLKQLLGSNAMAILYPYLRSYISLITSQSNRFPAYILPVMNFIETIKEEGSVNFIGFSDENNE